MTIWCMAHPWMTFFIVLSLIAGIVEVAKAFNHIKDNDENDAEDKESK